MPPSFLLGYFSYWDGKEFPSITNQEERCGWLSASYEIITGEYRAHVVYGNLGIIGAKL